MLFEKLASAVRNNVLSGLQGYHMGPSFTLEQIEDDIIDVRLQLIQTLEAQGVLPLKDFLLEINCINIDCKDLEKCSKCSGFTSTTPTAHFEIPQIYNGTTGGFIAYIGSADKQNSFDVYTSATQWKLNKYKRRKKNKPYVYVDTTPNENNLYDCYVFNAPLLKVVSVIAVFKDPRQLEEYGCCDSISVDNMNPINNQIKLILTDQYLKYYRQLQAPNRPNTLTLTV